MKGSLSDGALIEFMDKEENQYLFDNFVEEASALKFGEIFS